LDGAEKMICPDCGSKEIDACERDDSAELEYICNKCDTVITTEEVTAEEKLQAIYEAGYIFYIKTDEKRLRQRCIDVCYNSAREGDRIFTDFQFTNIKDAVDWLYDNTVGKSR
jgi:hypothetical protein